MKFPIRLLWLCILAAGCTPSPRFTSGDSGDDERPERRSKYAPPEANRPKGRSDNFHLNDNLRLGWIIQGYLGRPYKRNSKYDPGMDCSEFTRAVFREYLKTDFPRTTDEQFSTGRQVSKSRLMFGDLVFFRTDGRGVSHVGIWVGYDEFVHASTSEGVIISSMDDEYWSQRYLGARRILE